MIHDAARPFIDHALLDRIAGRLEAGNEAVLPAMPVSDTLKRAAGGKVLETVPRSALHAAQTPQSFHLATILAAHERAAAIQKNDFTDDCTIAEWAGIPVTIVEGSPDKIQLTGRRRPEGRRVGKERVSTGRSRWE